MARRRMIDPSFWEDPTIGNLSLAARLCFIGMVSHADDEGRLDVDPRYIRRAIFGFDDEITTAHVSSYLGEIRDKCRNVVFYEVTGRALACFLNWRRYQYIQKKQDSRLPPPADATDNHSDITSLSEVSVTATVPVAPNRIEENRREKNREGNDSGTTVPPRPTDPLLNNPAVRAYREHFKLTPTTEQRALIAETVNDLSVWASTLKNWQLSNNKPSNVLGLVDWYQNGGRPFPPRSGTRNGAPPPPGQPPLTMDDLKHRAAALTAERGEA